METKLLNLKGEEVGKVDLREDLFGVKPHREFLHEFVTTYLANQRRGTAHTKTRAEVSGGGKKPWKQKHTGRARAGSSRSPLWRHGGITFGPRAHGRRQEMPRQKARLALAQALSARASDGGLILVENLACSDAKTKTVAAMLKSLNCTGKIALVVDAPNPNLSRASRNIPDVAMFMAADLNAYCVLRCKKMVMTTAALEKLTASRPAAQPSASKPAAPAKKRGK